MARPRSPDSILAEKMFHDGMKLVEIADKLGYPAGTVRRWKSTQKWEESSKKKSERSENKKANVRKKGAPKRNRNAEKHGIYNTIYWDSLDENEIQLIDEIEYSEEYQLKRQIDLFTIRERRLMLRIKEYKEAAIKTKGMLAKSITKEKGIERGHDTNIIHTEMEADINTIMLLEAELTKVQRAKTKVIDSLMRSRIENSKGIQKDNELLDDGFIEALNNSAREDWLDEEQ